MTQHGNRSDAAFDPENPYALTHVEQQVVDLLISGLTGAEIADLLSLDRRSVALRRASAMRKYGARNGLHLAHLIEITRRPAASDLATRDIAILEYAPGGTGI
jgi:DNA-binding NarL/FixJ family response regulator